MIRIGVDIDDVLFPWSRLIHQSIVNQGLDNGAQITRWELWRDYGMRKSDFWQHVNAEYVNGLLLNDPQVGAQNFLSRLATFGEIHLITARGTAEGELREMVKDDTRSWLTWHELEHDSLNFAHDKTTFDCDYFLDDRPETVARLREVGTEAFLFDAPHNQGSDLPRIYKLHDFLAVVSAYERTYAF